MRHQFARLPGWVEDSSATRTYVEHGGEIVTRHPFDLVGVRMFGFALPADPERLSDMCQRTFAGPSGGAEQFAPVGSHVVVAFAEILQIRSTDAPDDWIGSCREKEAAVWVPVFDRRRDRAAWTLPYIFVDEPAPMCGGREIFGLPKQLGEVTIPGDDGQSNSFGLKAPCIDRFGRDARMERRSILSVRRTDVVDQAPAAGSRRRSKSRAEPAESGLNWAEPVHGLNSLQKFRNPQDREPILAPRSEAGFLGLSTKLARGQVSGWTDEVRVCALLLSHLAFRRLPVVTLKQFRDIADPSRACYQAVVEVDQEITGFKGGTLLPGTWQVDVPDLDGEPLQRELGLRSMTTDLAFRLDFAFRINAGCVLWEAHR